VLCFVRHGTRIKLIVILFAYRRTVDKVSLHQRQMASYVTEELRALVTESFPIDPALQSIFGHSMGGHGAITIALRNPGSYRSVSAFAPIAQPMTADWSVPAFEKYLVPDRAPWRKYVWKRHAVRPGYP
jgi:S-formylglutathione hydrolase